MKKTQKKEKAGLRMLNKLSHNKTPYFIRKPILILETILNMQYQELKSQTRTK